MAPALGPYYQIQGADYKWAWEGTMNGPRPMLQSEWARLEEHFAHHASLVDRFSAAGPPAVLGMVRSGRNERGQVLSAFEREALVERHCELFRPLA